MRKEEFLRELEDALQGEVPASVIRENVSYYNSYISKEAASGRSEEEVIEEIGGPRLIARTIIDSSEAAGEIPESDAGGYYRSEGDSYREAAYGENENRAPGFHYIDLNKWYVKLIVTVVLLLVLFVVFTVLGGIFALLFRFAGPLILIWLIVSLFRGMRQ